MTLQLRAEQERERINAQENRRAAIDAALSGFLERVESLLQTVDHNAITMRSTATALFAASNKNSERAEGAVAESNKTERPRNPCPGPEPGPFQTPSLHGVNIASAAGWNGPGS